MVWRVQQYIESLLCVPINLQLQWNSNPITNLLDFIQGGEMTAAERPNSNMIFREKVSINGLFSRSANGEIKHKHRISTYTFCKISGSRSKNNTILACIIAVSIGAIRNSSRTFVLDPGVSRRRKWLSELRARKTPLRYLRAVRAGDTHAHSKFRSPKLRLTIVRTGESLSA